MAGLPVSYNEGIETPEYQKGYELGYSGASGIKIAEERDKYPENSVEQDRFLDGVDDGDNHRENGLPNQVKAYLSSKGYANTTKSNKGRAPAAGKRRKTRKSKKTRKHRK